MKRSAEYLAFLIRLWRDESQHEWRATVQDAHAGEQHSFASLSALLLFLETQTGQPWRIEEGPVSSGGAGLVQ